ncbi:unnamed protein product [Ambrosiozyma monospora]|uniref:Unnamed protein product n=1 Tax=Ambrosiozyma monospora TaxID=43982 RepID=A0ACB5TRH3_AMBMO|nr:unnamed protein product [Ambrosiozyma monospora]
MNGTSLNTTGLVKAYYETGRDPSGVISYVEPAIYKFSASYSSILRHNIYPALLSELSSSQLNAARESQLLTSYPTIDIVDGRPLSDDVFMAPLQVGLFFLVLITFFQVLWNSKLNGHVAKVLNPVSYIAYRMIIVQVTFLVLSLAVTIVNRALEVLSWKGGFGVGWMIHFLAISSVGGATENVCLLALPHLPLAGFWFMFFVIINVSATLNPIETCPEFYRFTYSMPLHNFSELLKIMFFDTFTGHVGRYVGVLISWIALNNILMPFCLMFASFKLKKSVQKLARAKMNQ